MKDLYTKQQLERAFENGRSKIGSDYKYESFEDFHNNFFYISSGRAIEKTYEVDVMIEYSLCKFYVYSKIDANGNETVQMENICLSNEDFHKNYPYEKMQDVKTEIMAYMIDLFSNPS